MAWMEFVLAGILKIPGEKKAILWYLPYINWNKQQAKEDESQDDMKKPFNRGTIVFCFVLSNI